jgi:hypothetical protein
MIKFDKVTNIFCIVDEFCNNFDDCTENFVSGNPLIISKSKEITTTILFH